MGEKKRYDFKVELSGYGETPEEAWEEAFAHAGEQILDYAGSEPPDYEVEGESPAKTIFDRIDFNSYKTHWIDAVIRMEVGVAPRYDWDEDTPAPKTPDELEASIRSHLEASYTYDELINMISVEYMRVSE